MATSALSEVYDKFTVYGELKLIWTYFIIIIPYSIKRVDRAKNLSPANSHGNVLQQYPSIAESTRMAETTT